MALALAIKPTSYVRIEANTIAFYAQLNDALTGHGNYIRVRIQTPTKEIIFTSSVNSAHALTTCVASTWSGARLIIEISGANLASES